MVPYSIAAQRSWSLSLVSGLTTSTPSSQKKALEEVDVNLTHQFEQLHHAITDNHQGSSSSSALLDLNKV
jgi:hypothetical protein